MKVKGIEPPLFYLIGKPFSLKGGKVELVKLIEPSPRSKLQ